MRDLWTGDDLGTTRQTLETEVPGHDVLMVRLPGFSNPATDGEDAMRTTLILTILMALTQPVALSSR